MNESIIVGLVIGGGVAVIGALIGHFFRLREMNQQWDREKQRMEALWAEEKQRMEALWAKEERRRKSDRRREIREGMLRTVSDAIDAFLVARRKLGHMGPLLGAEDKESRLRVAAEVSLAMDRSRTVVVSLGDGQLSEEYTELFKCFVKWHGLLDYDTGEAKEGKEEEFERWGNKMYPAASEVQRLIGEMLEEV